MAYRFRFAGILGYRRNLEELARQKLGLAQTQLERQQMKLTELEEQLRLAIAQFEERKRGAITAPLYVMFFEGIERLERTVAVQRQAVVSQRRVVEQSREDLVEKVRARKVMEKTKERDYEAYLREELRRDQAELDEQMVLRFGRH